MSFFFSILHHIVWLIIKGCKAKKETVVLVSSIFGGEYKYRGKKYAKMEIDAKNVFYLVVYRLTIG